MIKNLDPVWLTLDMIFSYIKFRLKNIIAL